MEPDMTSSRAAEGHSCQGLELQRVAPFVVAGPCPGMDIPNMASDLPTKQCLAGSPWQTTFSLRGLRKLMQGYAQVKAIVGLRKALQPLSGQDHLRGIVLQRLLLLPRLLKSNGAASLA